jgi:hypothetical protein
MDLWILVPAGVAVVGLFYWLAKRAAKTTADNGRVLTEKHGELYASLLATHQLFGEKQVTNEEAYALLVSAATRLAPANWMVSTRRIISVNDYLTRYVEGHQLIKQARERAGV